MLYKIDDFPMLRCECVISKGVVNSAMIFVLKSI